MKKIIIFLTFILFTIELYSQIIERPTYKNGFTFNIESILAADIKFTYSRRINDKLYFESMLSYNIPYPFPIGINNQFSFIRLKDPYCYYGRIQIRAGLKQYLSRRFYLGEMLLYGYGSFNKKDVAYPDLHKHCYSVSRYKNEIEALLKCGWTFQKNHLLQDLYMGLGFRMRFLNDKVLGYDSSEESSENYFPYNKNYSYGMITFHLGYQLGYCK